MTVAVAVVARDGIVLASDSMASDVTIATTSAKLRTVPGLPLVWTFAGSEHLAQVAQRALDSSRRQAPQGLDDAAAILEGIVGVVRPAVIQAVTLLHPDAEASSRQVEFLIAGIASDGPFAASVHGDLSYVLEREQLMPVMGSAKMFAAAVRQSVTHYLTGPLVLADALPIAWRVVDTVSQVSAYGVAPPVQLATADSTGARLLGVDEIGRVEEQVQAWIALESATLHPHAAKSDSVSLPRLNTSAQADIEVRRSRGSQ